MKKVSIYLLLFLVSAIFAEYPSGYFYAIFRGDTFCVQPIITDSTTEAAWFDYTSASMHTGFETAFESHFFFFYNPMTGNIGFVIQHNIDEIGTADATCIVYLDDIPSACSLAMSDDAGEFDLTAYPQGNWHWWDNTDGGAFYIPRDEWQFTIRTTYGSTDPILSIWFISGDDGSARIRLDTVYIDQEDTLIVGHGFLQLLAFVDSLDFDSVNVYTTDTLHYPVCNSDETIDTLIISGVSLNHPEAYTVLYYPTELAPGECDDIIVTFHPSDTGYFYDTLEIDKFIPCDSTTYVPIFGHSIQPRIDSVWFSEETDCDGQNIVEICYNFYGDAESFFPVNAQFSMDTSTGLWFDFADYTLEEFDDDMGDSISPGIHCFYWIMSDDMPNVEVNNFAVEIAAGEITHTQMEIPSLSTTTEYWDTITMSWLPAVEIYFSGWGTRILPGSSWLWDSVYTGSILHRCLTFRCIIETAPGAVIDSASVDMYVDNAATFYMNGDSIGADDDGSTWTTIWTFDMQPFMHGGADTMTIIACDLSAVAVGLDFLATVFYTIPTFYSDTAIGPVDSKPPDVSLNCPADTVYYGDTLSFPWTVDDFFPNAAEQCSVFVHYCDGIDTFLADDSIIWTPPMVFCDSAYIAVSAPDSFCNWGYDTCIFAIIAAGSIQVVFPETSAYACDTIDVAITAQDIFLPIMSEFNIWFKINSSIATVLDFTPAVAPAADSIYFDGSGDDWFIKFMWSTRNILENDTLGYVKLTISCDADGGDITPLYIDSVTSDIIDT
ncbi:hypothetical protein J7L68_09115, partial [bacterium]|nr:hypothetical protein [bacterium]